MIKIKNITVIGLGLIGGSLALAFKELNPGFKIKGFDIDREALNIAKYRNMIDSVSVNYADAVRDADLVVIATPISRIKDVLISISGNLREGAIITDVGSAKKNIVEALTGFVMTCLEMGTLETVLKDCGFKPFSMPRPKKLAPKSSYVNIPIHLLTQSDTPNNCHA